MKPVAIILIVLSIAALAGAGYLYLTANVTVTGTGCVATDALDAQDSFDDIKDAVAGETFVGTVFSDVNDCKAEDCQFFTYTLRIKNDSFIAAEAVEIQVTPMSGDILQTGDTVRHDLPARSSADFQIGRAHV